MKNWKGIDLVAFLVAGKSKRNGRFWILNFPANGEGERESMEYREETNHTRNFLERELKRNGERV